MESPKSMEDEPISIDPAEPFKGIVVCCTSIQPEYRTEIAQKVHDLGGVHKYDLTPDVTHLIVGDYDTPKYRHVARERQDIHAMDAAWVDAVSKLWKNDEHIDFLKLEKENQLQPLETKGAIPGAKDSSRQSLLVCLTGFGHQRDEIASKIVASGGRHTDDLTRRCTHLVVSKPEGKKFTAAKAWNIRTVTLTWLEQSIERGMILEEEKYDPLLPPEEQGVGAWIKRDPRRQSLGKRARSGAAAGTEEGTRKLRKTASMKLSSQRNSMWGDILGRSDSREYSFAQERPPEEPSRETPPPKQEKQPEKKQETPQENRGIFFNCIFYIHGFGTQKTSVLSHTIKGIDGQIASTLYEAANSGATHRFLIVPQASQPEQHPQVPSDDLHVVTEFYIEKCLHNRKFFPPSDHHALGRPFPLFPIPGFDNLTICTAAFTGIELSQVARSVAQLGAKFEEQFRRSTSVLVCKSLESMRKDKLRAALAWGVPVVTADWLWECIATGYNVPVDNYIYPEIKGRLQRKTPSTEEPTQEKKPTTRPVHRTHSEPVPRTTRPATSKPTTVPGVDNTAFDRDSPDKHPQKRQTITHEDSADFTTARTHQAPTDTSFDPPLTELSSASINKSKSPSPAKALPRRARSDPFLKDEDNDDEGTPVPAEGEAEEGHQEVKTEEDDAETEESKRRAAKAAERQALTSKLTTLIDSTAGAAASAEEDPTAPAAADQPRPRRRQILGRAISNVSAGSSSAASAPVTTSMTMEHEEAEHEQPPATQVGYDDPEAQGHKAALMDRMMGGSGDVKVAAGAGKGAGSAGVVGGRSLRRR